MADENKALLSSTDGESDAEFVPGKRSPPVYSPGPPGEPDPVPVSAVDYGKRTVKYGRLPIGMWLLEKTGLLNFSPLLTHKGFILVLTFICYTSYHLSRKPFSVVKVVFCPDCVNCTAGNGSEPGWAPFNNNTNAKTLLGAIDYSWLFAYALAMFVSGQIADRVNLRYFLFFGMTGSGVSVALLGVAYFANIHSLWYFIVVQIFGGVMQSTGWPGTVAVMSHWFGKHNRGLIMGVWNSHTSVGNILGTIIPAFWADCDGDMDPWGWSFLVPAMIIMAAGVLLFLFLVVNPKDVGLSPPKHDTDTPGDQSTPSRGPGDPPMYQANNATDKDQQRRLREREVIEQDEGSRSIQQSIATAPQKKSKPVNIFRAFLIPGVLEFAFALFFDKLVSYTFLYWLPFYVKNKLTFLSGPESDWLSTLFDVGGIIGGIIAGVVSDQLKARALTCVVMLLAAIPSLYVLEAFASSSFGFFIAMLVICGVFVNGPYSMITTAVSSDLGTHKSLQNNQNAKATVTAIIDGTGSLGAAFGPLIIGWVTTEWDWMAAFYVLMGSCFLSALLLTRLVVADVVKMTRRCCIDRGLCCDRYQADSK